MDKVDIHVTTCYHTDVKCRPRQNDYNIAGFNIEGWTQEEKIQIGELSISSLSDFVSGLPISILDDGSNIIGAHEMFGRLQRSIDCSIFHYEHKGSSNGINDYFKKTISDDTLICHFEDDHIYFNPENLDWMNICRQFLIDHKDVGVVSLRSGFPTDPNYPDYKGAWGPVGWRHGITTPPAFLFKFMGNSHHIMLYKTYKKFLPMSGSSGGCEAYMCQKLVSMDLYCAEIQMPVYAFHSHALNKPMPSPVTSKELNMCARGREYGIKDMSDYLASKMPIAYTYYTSPQKECTFNANL